MFGKVLVANRGEIAIRIIRACKEMGVKTVRARILWHSPKQIDIYEGKHKNGYSGILPCPRK